MVDNVESKNVPQNQDNTDGKDCLQHTQELLKSHLKFLSSSEDEVLPDLDTSDIDSLPDTYELPEKKEVPFYKEIANR